ncbi:YggT family protein [Neobacillus sp. PS3-34]|uniref:YggT family protein n=1 Tax=Neobacillus sp. PS3-34 TaxID=3070678 RepID=UPI0027E09D56|nr:YggT family protein [Neobacillus sp. PS3-34]WML48603.1 YggT family protein [Neobacillus sp. PS3-34]
MGTVIFQIGQYIYDIYYWLILIFIFGSWFPQFHKSRIGIGIGKLVNPYLAIFRRFIPPFGVIDFSAYIALIAYRYLGGFALQGFHQVLKMIGL